MAVLRGQKKVWQKVVTVKKSEIKNDLFEKLRLVRRELAIKANLPPYMIFSDATLAQMAQDKPSSVEEMSQIKGVGEFKLNKYGDDFLRVIKNFMS